MRSIPIAVEPYIIMKRRYASKAKRRFAVFFAKPSTDLSVKPRFKIVSIIPGIETGAPERTETKSGSLGSPSFLPALFSSFCKFSFTDRSKPAGYFLLFE